jgi:hypothetical protein
MKNPGCTKFLDIGCGDLVKAAVAAAGIVTVVRRPVGGDGSLEQILIRDGGGSGNGGLPVLRDGAIGETERKEQDYGHE